MTVTNLPIQGRNLRCGFDFDPTFRDWLVEHNAPGKIESIEKVADELSAGKVAPASRAEARSNWFFLCGSVLEAALLGTVQQAPAKFNQANSTPKTANGSPKRFHEWSLVPSIDVAYEVGILRLDVWKFSHGLRDFRNDIHPYERMASGFTSDEHAAKVCFQVLKAALASLVGEHP